MTDKLVYELIEYAHNLMNIIESQQELLKNHDTQLRTFAQLIQAIKDKQDNRNAMR